jgi:hypothetical protein
MSNQHKVIAVQLLSQSAIDDKAKEKSVIDDQSSVRN